MVRSDSNSIHEDAPTSSALSELLEVTRELRDNFSRLIGAGKNVAGESLDRVRTRAGDLMQRGRDRAKTVASDTADYVQEEPMKTLLIAAAAGVVIGWFINRHR
jgi:ElaB/YqjD/DUF883 family membrane-anchored ribosome-binding protein